MKEEKVLAGKLLLAKPYLGDPNFERSVVLVCEHSAEGAFGLVLNQGTQNVLSDFFDDVISHNPVFLGGPVENHTLHFLHKRGDLIEGSIKLVDGLYWSGNFEQIKVLLLRGEILPEDIRFFLGYSGWGAEQLEMELEENTWVLADTKPEFIFDVDPAKSWSTILRNLGGNHIMMANAPADPRLN